jgi:hypothetical protein
VINGGVWWGCEGIGRMFGIKYNIPIFVYKRFPPYKKVYPIPRPKLRLKLRKPELFVRHVVKAKVWLSREQKKERGMIGEWE